MIRKDICLINLLKSIQKVRLMENVLLSRRQRVLLKYQRHFAVEEGTEEKESEEMDIFGPLEYRDRQ